MAKIYENTKEIKENNLRGAAAPRRGAAGGSAFVFFIFLSIFVYFANNPSHWDGNPGIVIVNPNNPKQSQFRQKPAEGVSFKLQKEAGLLDAYLLLPSQPESILAPQATEPSCGVNCLLCNFAFTYTPLGLSGLGSAQSVFL